MTVRIHRASLAVIAGLLALMLAAPPAHAADPPDLMQSCRPSRDVERVRVPGVGTLACFKNVTSDRYYGRNQWQRVDSKTTRRAAVPVLRAFVAQELGQTWLSIFCKRMKDVNYDAFFAANELSTMEWSLGWPISSARFAVGVVGPQLCGTPKPAHWDEWVKMDA